MGILKKIKINKFHRKKYYKIKQYSFYRKDFFGFLKYKRFYKYKIILYNMLRKKKKFYYTILNYVYHGIKFFNKRYSYKSNILLQKKSLKYFYGLFYDSYIGKIGKLIKRKKGIRIDNFFGLLERRLDILIYRACYILTIRQAYLTILQKIVIVNKQLQKKPHFFVFLGDLIFLSCKPNHQFFFFYSNLNKILNWQRFYVKKSVNSLALINYSVVLILKRLYIFLSMQVKKIPYGFFFSQFQFQQQLILFLFFFVMFQKFLLKQKKNIYTKQRTYFYIQKKAYMKAISKFVEIFKYSILKHQKVFLLYTNIKFLYGQKNIKKRFKFLYFFIAPSYKKKYLFKKNKYFFLLKKKRKQYRFQKFSKKSFKYLSYLNGFSLFYKSYSSFLEVNYRIHVILFQTIPSLFSISYPFGVPKNMLYKYFKLKSYF